MTEYLEDRNPNVDNSATVFDVVPGALLELVRIDEPDGVSRTMQVLSGIKSWGGFGNCIDVLVVEEFPDGQIDCNFDTRSLTGLGITPDSYAASPWNPRWATRLLA